VNPRTERTNAASSATTRVARLKRPSVCYCHTHGSYFIDNVGPQVNAAERAVLEAAAEQSHTSLSEFVRRKALESAEIEVLNRAVVSIPAKDWAAFTAWVRRPAKKLPALVELTHRKPSWEG
jgi:uncharacterized protein (DUF1778 family)